MGDTVCVIKTSSAMWVHRWLNHRRTHMVRWGGDDTDCGPHTAINESIQPFIWPLFKDIGRVSRTPTSTVGCRRPLLDVGVQNIWKSASTVGCRRPEHMEVGVHVTEVCRTSAFILPSIMWRKCGRDHPSRVPQIGGGLDADCNIISASWKMYGKNHP